MSLKMSGWGESQDESQESLALKMCLNMSAKRVSRDSKESLKRVSQARERGRERASRESLVRASRKRERERASRASKVSERQRRRKP